MEAPFHRGLLRPMLVMGADREMLMMTGLVAFALATMGQSRETIAFGIFIWFGSLFVLRRMAKADPLLRHVFLRSIRYKRFYPARSMPWRINQREYK